MEKITFWGRELNEYEIENKRLSYATMAHSFNAVLCNNITEIDPDIFCNIEGGEVYHIDGESYTGEEREELINKLKAKREAMLTAGASGEAIEHIDEKIDEAEDAESELPEIFQWFIVEDSAKWILEKAGEPLFYSDKLDCYIWGVTHYGTAWSHVLTSLELDDEFNLK